MRTQAKQFILTRKESSGMLGLVTSVVSQYMDSHHVNVNKIHSVDDTVYYTVHHVTGTVVYGISSSKQDNQYIIEYTLYVGDEPKHIRSKRINTTDELHVFLTEQLDRDI
jgi:predicted transcriptional regulator